MVQSYAVLSPIVFPAVCSTSTCFMPWTMMIWCEQHCLPQSGCSNTLSAGNAVKSGSLATVPVYCKQKTQHSLAHWRIITVTIAQPRPDFRVTFFLMKELYVACNVLCGYIQEVPAWKAAYKIAIQSEANRWRLCSHQEAVLKGGKKRLEFLDSKLTSRRLVQAKLVDCHDDPICDFVRESLDTWTTAKQQTHQELADHLQAVSSAYELFGKVSLRNCCYAQRPRPAFIMTGVLVMTDQYLYSWIVPDRIRWEHITQTFCNQVGFSWFDWCSYSCIL